MKYHEAVRDMPDLRMDADKLLLPQGVQIHSYDIGVILGNAVDNAIEACRKLKAKEPGRMFYPHKLPEEREPAHPESGEQL